MQFLETLHPIILVSQMKLKDVSAKQMLKLMYNTEFSETRLEGVGTGSANFKEFSYGDKKFLEMRTQRKWADIINFHYY